MPHTFFAPGLSGGNTYTLPEDESKHAVRVLRLREGDAVELIDGAGSIYQAEVAEAEAKRCQLRIVQQQQVPRRAYQVHVAVAPTKNLDRMEWLVEKATEVGIDRLSFMRCARSERRELKLERLERIAVSALKQSGQAWLPQLDELTDFATFVHSLDPATTFIAHLAEGERISLAQVAAAGNRCCILIGPEGDFTPEEIELALGRGIRPVTLGHTRLRTETAALAACHTVHVAHELA
ncbi:16S rRNA (uracil(1498)-N(3))-methyltransferase [Hymenobacter oligotrophus]|uniref:Ribosomal RNA small subunit methyltransferase E n=1 Tax=Hymenobacter oligotrophus TaxID=2319843 RepID=A0A3B7QXI6_9BACT|nr:16S rRNA (uracil(1498)-N(3))-methyltransferase [Hymenobacter oligotrophus]AYA36255.1 16S rRNA (uracil(1498)-N(3))-methyltransferase [Hymenobacter oligotrophus]